MTNYQELQFIKDSSLYFFQTIYIYIQSHSNLFSIKTNM